MQTPNNITKINYTRREAAAALGVSLVTLDAYRHRANNHLPYFLAGTNKVLIPVAALNEWVMNETQRVSAGR